MAVSYTCVIDAVNVPGTQSRDYVTYALLKHHGVGFAIRPVNAVARSPSHSWGCHLLYAPASHLHLPAWSSINLWLHRVQPAVVLPCCCHLRLILFCTCRPLCVGGGNCGQCPI